METAPERIFTIYEGPQAGTRFVLGDRPLTLGRGPERDVVLRDDRASRLHTRLLPDGDGATVVDEGSSNGTFVNGRLVVQMQVKPGDILTIGNTSIIFGAAPPTPQRLAALRALSDPQHQAHGSATQILYDAPAPELTCAPVRFGEIVEAVADAAEPSVRARGASVVVEVEGDPGQVEIDGSLLYRALAGLLARMLELMPAAPAEAVMALRYGRDEERGGVALQFLCVGWRIPRAEIAAALREAPFTEAARVARAHGGLIEVRPADTSDALARLRLPLRSPGASHGARSA